MAVALKTAKQTPRELGMSTFKNSRFCVHSGGNPNLRLSAQSAAKSFPEPSLSCTLIPMKTFLCLCICFTAIAASAQHLVDQKTFDAIATEYSGEAAQENTRRIVEYHRIQGSPMMAPLRNR